MAKYNYVKLTHGDNCLIIGFYKPCGEMVDVIDSTNPFLTNSEQESIQMWINQGISPSEYEDQLAIARDEMRYYGKFYNR